MKHFPIPVREIAKRHLDAWTEVDHSQPGAPTLQDCVEDAINEAVNRWTKIQNEEPTHATD